jgi:hypothetical protein
VAIGKTNQSAWSSSANQHDIEHRNLLPSPPRVKPVEPDMVIPDESGRFRSKCARGNQSFDALAHRGVDSM